MLKDASQDAGANSGGTEARHRILVVEDESIVARDIQATLRRLGYEVPFTVASSEAALEKAAELRPHLVMQDINIRGERNGIETAQLLRERFGVPVIFLTAYSDDDTLNRAKKAQPYGFLLKPFEERELLASIETALYKHAMEARLRESEARLAATLRSIGDAVVAADNNGRVVFLNGAAEALSGWSASEAIGMDVEQIIRFAQGMALHSQESTLARAVREELTGSPGDPTVLLTRDGQTKPIEHTSSPIEDCHGEIFGTVIACRDVTERKALEDRLLYQAFHDPLTGIANRALFYNRLRHTLTKAARLHSHVAVLFIDMDNFKVVNDSLGHAAGDDLLCEVATRLQNSLRGGDTVARFGGDEFTVLLERADNPRDAMVVAERILQNLEAPYHLQGQTVYSSPSIGIAFNVTDDLSPDEMLRHADTAMYQAKNEGRACYRVFRDTLSEAALHRLELGNDLRLAIERNEMELHYQPKIDLSSGRIYGVEALLRWRHPQRGLLMPAEFLGLAEEIGFIVPLGRWVLREACGQARQWQDAYPGDSQLARAVNVSARQLHGDEQKAAEHHSHEATNCPLQLNVNLSLRQLRNPELVADVAAILEEVGLAADNLVLEITESVAMEETAATTSVLNELKKIGVRLAIDDFGTGYSSLAYLKAFPLDFLKIDRKFVMALRDGDSVILDSMVHLAHALDLQVVAEGAETEAEVDLLRGAGCDLAQGYFFGRPMSAKQFSDILAAQSRE